MFGVGYRASGPSAQQPRRYRQVESVLGLQAHKLPAAPVVPAHLLGAGTRCTSPFDVSGTFGFFGWLRAGTNEG